MDKWLLLCNDVSLAGRLRTIEDGLRASGITSFYTDIVKSQRAGELAELRKRFEQERERK